MNYPHIKAAKLSHAKIAKAFGFKNINSFRCSSAHKRYMKGIEEVLRMTSPEKYEHHMTIDLKTNKVLESNFVKVSNSATFKQSLKAKKKLYKELNQITKL